MRGGPSCTWGWGLWLLLSLVLMWLLVSLLLLLLGAFCRCRRREGSFEFACLDEDVVEFAPVAMREVSKR